MVPLRIQRRWNCFCSTLKDAEWVRYSRSVCVMSFLRTLELIIYGTQEDDAISVVLKALIPRFAWMHVRVTRSTHHIELPGRF